MLTRATTRRLAVAMLSAAALSGCGSSSSGGLSKQQLAGRTDGVCRSSAAKIRAISPPSDFATNPQAAAAYLGQISTIYHDARSQLDALTPADSVTSQWNAVTTRLAAVVKLVDDVTQKARSQNRSGLAELEQLGPLTSALNQATQAIGANCASA